MKVILDTHVFLWSLAAPERFDENRRQLIESRTNEVFVSAITMAELAIKDSIGKLCLDFDPVELAKKSGFELLPFLAEEALFLKDLPFHHRDPFDRMLIAQSIATTYPIMTDDEKFRSYGCKLL
jgi:PIN domain nuclease of toxin-antitoxin system